MPFADLIWYLSRASFDLLSRKKTSISHLSVYMLSMSSVESSAFVQRKALKTIGYRLIVQVDTVVQSCSVAGKHDTNCLMSMSLLSFRMRLMKVCIIYWMKLWCYCAIYYDEYGFSTLFWFTVNDINNCLFQYCCKTVTVLIYLCWENGKISYSCSVVITVSLKVYSCSFVSERENSYDNCYYVRYTWQFLSCT